MSVFESELDQRLDTLVEWLASQSEDHFIRTAVLRMAVRDFVHKLSDTFEDSAERWALDEQLEVMNGVATEKAKKTDA